MRQVSVDDLAKRLELLDRYHVRSYKDGILSIDIESTSMRPQLPIVTDVDIVGPLRR